MHTHKLNDKIIRTKILESLVQNNNNQDSIIIEELDLCLGEARIDLAIINGLAKGIEIKSDKDTLDRLDHQIPTYNKIFDHIEIVVGKKHEEEVTKKVPSWWGISTVTYDQSNHLLYTKIRDSETNKSKDPFSIIQLLWKNEALLLLEKKNLSCKFKYKSRDEIWKQLLITYEEEELCEFVNLSLKKRLNWRFVHQQI